MRRWGTLFLLLLGAYVGVEGLFRDRWVNLRVAKPLNSAGKEMAASHSLADYVMNASAEPVSDVSVTEETVARKFLQARSKDWGLKPYHEFRPIPFKTPLGTHVKFSVLQSGLPLVGLDIEVTVSKDLTVVGHVNRYRGVDYVDLESADSKSYDEVVGILSKQHQIDSNNSSGNPVLFVPAEGTVPELAYVVGIKDSINRTPAQVMVRAIDGKIVGKSLPRSD